MKAFKNQRKLKPWPTLSAAIMVAVGACFTQNAHGQTTAWTYQGSLRSTGVPVTGLYDMRFRLFDVAAGGTQIGATVCTNNVQVQAGLFTTVLDFGQQFVTRSPRYLEIEVRADAGLDCNNSAGFVVLGPRQLLTAAPFASHADTAFSLSSPAGSSTNVFVDNSGRVGIGTQFPAENLHIAGTTPALVLQDTDSTGTAQVGFVSLQDSAGLERAWFGYGSQTDSDLSLMNRLSGGNTVLGTASHRQLVVTGAGDVGIGTSTPSAKLHVVGDLKVDGAIAIDPGTRYYSMHASAFRHDRDTPSLLNGPPFLDEYGLDSANESRLAPVNLPHGAVVTRVSMTFRDVTSEMHVEATLARTSLDSGDYAEMATVSSAETYDIAVRRLYAPVTRFSVIDNSSFAYWVRITFNEPTHEFITVRFVAFQIEYTISSPLP